MPLAALIHSNSRISDARADLTKQIEALKETLRAEIRAMKVEMSAGFGRVEAALHAHELEHPR